MAGTNSVKCCLKYNDGGSIVGRLCIDPSGPEPRGWECTWVENCANCPAYPSTSEAQGLIDQDEPGAGQYAVLESDPRYYGSSDTEYASTDTGYDSGYTDQGYGSSDQGYGSSDQGYGSSDQDATTEGEA